MNKSPKFFVVLFAICAIFGLQQAVNAQTASEEYSGNIISFNGPQVETAFFTLRVNKLTSTEDRNRYLGILRDNGQDNLLSAIRKEDAGTFSIDGQLGRTVNVIRETQVDGRTRIFAVFERWTRFAEVRGGYRSLDYPFGVIELFVDEKTGKGEGTYIAAARITWDNDKKTNQERVEIENFGTYPAKLTNVTVKTAGKVR